MNDKQYKDLINIIINSVLFLAFCIAISGKGLLGTSLTIAGMIIYTTYCSRFQST